MGMWFLDKGGRGPMQRMVLLGVLVVFFLTAVSFAAAVNAESLIYVEKIITQVSAILTEEEIEEVVGKYERRTVSIQDLNEAVAEFNQLYHDKGYVTAQALLPHQTIEDGIVHITLVEGRIGEFFVAGNESTNAEFLTDRIGLKSGDLFELKVLEEDILRLNLTHNIQLKGSLQAGSSYGTTDVVLNVHEPKNFNGQLFVDNAGRKETGFYRTGLTMTTHSLTGRRDQLNLNYLRSKAVNSGSLSYDIPVRSQGERMSLSYSRSHAKIISGPFETSDIEGRTILAGLEYRYPGQVSVARKTEFRGAFNYRISSNLFDEVELTSTRYQTLTGGWNSHVTGTNYTRSIRYNVNRSFGEDIESFYKLDGQFAFQSVRDNGHHYSIRASGQWTSNELLLSSEQYGIGGMNTVRGFPEGVIAGDSGYLLSGEYHFSVSDLVNSFVFLDHGGVIPYKGDDETMDENDYITSIGLGTVIALNQNISGRLVVGIPIYSEGYRTMYHFSVQTILW